MDFIEGIERGLKILGLNQECIEETSEDQYSLGMTLLIPAIVGVIIGIVAVTIGFGELPFLGEIPNSYGSWAVIAYPIVYLVGLYITTGINWLVAFLLGGKSSFGALLRPIGHTYLIGVFNAIPVIGVLLSMLASLYLLVVNVTIIKSVYGFSWKRAIATVAIPVVFFAIVFAVILILIAAASVSEVGYS